MIFSDEPRAAPNLADEKGNVWRVLESHQKQIDAINQRFAGVHNDLVRHEAMITRKPTIEDEPQAVSNQANRTIKGGWVNVHWGSPPENRCFTAVFNTREIADGQKGTRIACIQIPDFQEGEGL